MNIAAYFHGRRDRRLAALIAVALLTVALAVAALLHRQAVVEPKHKPMPLFPGLAYKIANGEATRIYIVSKKYGAFTIAFVPNKGWVLPDRGNYPASFETVQQTLIAIGTMQTVEPKTDRPGWFHYLDLDPPPQGNGVNVTLSTDKGYILASMIAGKEQQMGDGSGLFVRRGSETQSWLVRSSTAIKSNPADWMDKNVVSLEAARIASAEVRPAAGPAYTASRAKPDDGFTVAPLPKGRELSYPGAADAIAGALAGFSFDDIRPRIEFDFSNGARLILHTFDGVTVTADLVRQDGADWVRLFASSVPGNKDAAKEALQINDRATGWAFKLPPYKASSFAPALETLLKEKK